MNRVLCKNNGVLVSMEDQKPSHPVTLLSSELCLDDGFTLAGYFNLLEKNPLYRCVSEFGEQQARQGADAMEAGGIPGGPQGLEFGKTVEMIGYPGKPRMLIYNRLTGKRDGKPVDIRYEPLESLLSVPLALGKLRHVVFGDAMETMEFETVYTLFEFLDGMAWELSFFNAPAQCAIGR